MCGGQSGTLGSLPLLLPRVSWGSNSGHPGLVARAFTNLRAVLPVNSFNFNVTINLSFLIQYESQMHLQPSPFLRFKVLSFHKSKSFSFRLKSDLLFFILGVALPCCLLVHFRFSPLPLLVGHWWAPSGLGLESLFDFASCQRLLSVSLGST